MLAARWSSWVHENIGVVVDRLMKAPAQCVQTVPKPICLHSFQIIAVGVASFAAQVFCYPLGVIRTRQILVEAPAKREGIVVWRLLPIIIVLRRLCSLPQLAMFATMFSAVRTPTHVFQ
jgi:hypothetical protein